MSRRRRAALPAGADALRRRISEWRSTRKGRSRMPEALWKEAVGVANHCGVSEAARNLGLGYDSLKRRFERQSDGSDGGAGALPSFVEVSPAEVLDYEPDARTTVELQHPNGARVVVRMRAGADVDVAALASALCGGGE